MTIIVLTDEERDALRAHRENAPHKLMRRMAEAILMLSRGTSRRFIAEFVGRSVGTVGRWVGKWRRNGLDSIRTGHAGNRNACLLTGEQEEEVLDVPCPARPRSRDWMRSSGTSPTWRGGFTLVSA